MVTGLLGPSPTPHLVWVITSQFECVCFCPTPMMGAPSPKSFLVDDWKLAVTRPIKQCKSLI